VKHVLSFPLPLVQKLETTALSRDAEAVTFAFQPDP
jgi:hypothetical protein